MLGMTPSQYAKVLATNTLPCWEMYEENVRNEFIKGQDASIGISTSEYWGDQRKANLRDFAIHADSLFRF